jgi:hypothetical protein
MKRLPVVHLRAPDQVGLEALGLLPPGDR